MYFEEKMIDGVMCFRTTPDGEWRPFDIKELSRRYAADLNDDGWTYCDDRLPEEYGRFLCTERSGKVSNLTFANRHWYCDMHNAPLDVIAWRPLPAPAKGREG